MGRQIILDKKEVYLAYCSILRRCPQCGEIMIPLGDVGMEPYHHCFDCNLSIPMKEAEG